MICWAARLTMVFSICNKAERPVFLISSAEAPTAILNTVRTACMSVSPWHKKCSAVPRVSNVFTTASCTAAFVDAPALAVIITTCVTRLVGSSSRPLGRVSPWRYAQATSLCRQAKAGSAIFALFCARAERSTETSESVTSAVNGMARWLPGLPKSPPRSKSGGKNPANR